MSIHGGAGGWDLQGSAPPEAVQHSWPHAVPGTRLPVAKQHKCWAARSCHSPCPWRALRSWTCSWPLPCRESWEGSEEAAASRDRGMEGGSCEVTHQNHLPCSDGTMGLSPEQTSLPLKCCQPAAQPFVQSDWEMTCDKSGNSSSEGNCVQAATTALVPQLLLPRRGSV